MWGETVIENNTKEVGFQEACEGVRGIGENCDLSGGWKNSQTHQECLNTKWEGK